MSMLMRCIYCGCLQDEPAGVKVCERCGGELAYVNTQPPATPNYLQVQMELDQVSAPADKPVDRHLILTIQTPAQVPVSEAAPTKTGRKSMGFVIVLDVSGSMHGEKLAWAKRAVQEAIQHLHDGDIAALISFATEVETILPPTVVDSSLKQRLNSFLSDLNSGGQTALCGGLEAGIAAARQNPQDVNLVLLLSDGQANVGEIDLEKVGAHALKAAKQKIMVSTLGIGADYNEALMTEIATQGGGRFYHLRHAHQIAPYMAGELGEASALLAREVVLHLQLPPGTQISTFSTAYRVQEFAQIHLTDIPADTRLEIALTLGLPPQAANTQLRINGSLKYFSPANHQLEAVLNPVTIRYVENESFGIREGVVKAVVYRVLEQMEATGVLQFSRAGGLGQSKLRKRVEQDSVADISQYASLLGEEEANKRAANQRGLYDQMQQSSLDAKSAVLNAIKRHRSNKDFPG